MITNYLLPTKDGFFGEYGGRFVPPKLESVLKDLEKTYRRIGASKTFTNELRDLQTKYIGRPSSLYYCEKLTNACKGAKIYFKREDLNHTGAHKINNAIGQALIAKRMGKKKLIAETGAGQHGVAVATVAAFFGMECDVYMGKRDVINQSNNVYRMKLLGANVVEITDGQATLKDAVDAALNALIADPSVYYMLGSAVGPHPYPMMVRDFQKVIGEEVKEQMLKTEKRLPDYLVACVGGGSNAIGFMYPFILDANTILIAAEPAGEGVTTLRHGLSLLKGKLGKIHGFKCRVLQDKSGVITESYSAASGLDYPGVGPELSYLYDEGRLQVQGISDKEAVEAFVTLSRLEGIIPALESAHAIACTIKLAQTLTSDKIIVTNLSGRGDKDVENVFLNLMHG